MFVLLSDYPEFCVSCGFKFKRPDSLDRQDFYAKAAMTCPECKNTTFQYCTVTEIFETSKSTDGDMHMYHSAI